MGLAGFEINLGEDEKDKDVITSLFLPMMHRATGKRFGLLSLHMSKIGVASKFWKQIDKLCQQENMPIIVAGDHNTPHKDMVSSFLNYKQFSMTNLQIDLSNVGDNALPENDSKRI